jgi:hypothetical protein
VILSFIKSIHTIQPQQVFTDPKMIEKYLRGQDMQQFSWNLDNFKFEAGFEP